MMCMKYAHCAKSIFGGNIYVRSKFSCVRSYHDLRAGAHLHSLEGTLVPSPVAFCTEFVCLFPALVIRTRVNGHKMPGRKHESLWPPPPLANSAMMSTLITHCQWEDETVRGGLATCPDMPWLRK